MKDWGDIESILGVPKPQSLGPESIATLLWAREVLQAHGQKSYAVTNKAGIESLRAIPLNDSEQWVHIRGRNKQNPVLLYIYGGPGAPLIGCLDATLRPWEDYFTVVRWDQRQIGKSHYPAKENEEALTIEQFVEDTIAVVKHLREILSQEKLLVLGHSWGSVLGVHLANRYPQYLHAYIGLGQVVNNLNAEQEMFKRLSYHANKKNHPELIEFLDSIAPYPHPDNIAESFIKNGLLVRKKLSEIAGEAGIKNMSWDDGVMMLALNRTLSPQVTNDDLINSVFGDDVALLRKPYGFTKEFMAINLPEDIGYKFEVPVIFFTGKHDWHTPRKLSDQWFDRIEAPHKKRVVFDDSCHLVITEQPGKFLTALVDHVLPLTRKE